MTSISVPVDAGATAPIKIDTGQLDQLVKDLTKGSGSELLQSVQTFADRAPALIGFVENRIERFESAFLAARLAERRTGNCGRCSCGAGPVGGRHA